MCFYLFSPGKKIDVDYAVEAISLLRGESEAIADILFTNHSSDQIERIHIIYPHPTTKEEPPVDKTETWLDPGSPLNTYYGPLDILARYEGYLEPLPNYRSRHPGAVEPDLTQQKARY